MVARRGEIIVETSRWFRPRTVHRLDADSLTELRTERQPGGLRGTPSGESHAVVDGDHVTVFMDLHSDAAVALAGRPLADATPADLATLRAELGRDLAGSRARPFLELLLACLIPRFGADAPGAP